MPTTLARPTARRRARALLLLALVGAAAAAAPAAGAQRFRPDTASARLNARAFPLDAPRAVELPDGGVAVPLVGPPTRPVVAVTVDGHGPYRFVVETGAGFTAVSPEVAAAAGLAPADTADPTTVRVGALGVGAARIRDLRVGVMATAVPGVDGVLGLNAYRDLLLTLDYAGGTMRLARGTLGPANGRDRLALLPSDDLWEVALVVDGRPARAVLDTQGSGAFNVTPAAARGVRFAAPPAPTGTVQGPGIGVQPIHTARLAGDVRVGDVTFARPIVGIVPMPPGYPEHWNLGGPALAQFTVTLDQRARVLQLARPGRAPVPAPPAVHAPGFRAPVQAGRRVVAEVTPGGHAEARGVRVGDEVVLVDGAPAGALVLDAWTARLRRPGPVALRLRRGGRDVDVVLDPPAVVR
jgi:hypothetical protein